MLKVMIAEDDLLMADMLEEVLIQGGYEVCGIARTVEAAVAIGKLHKPDLAILDLRLADGGIGTEIVARLNRRGSLGVLYASGNAGQMGLTKLDGEACLGKPYRAADVVRALEIVEQLINGGAASQPFPQGFYVLNGTVTAEAVVLADAIESREIRRLRRQQAALAEFGTFALGESDLDKVLNEAARVCAEGLEVPYCKVCRYRPEQNDLLVEAGVGWHQGVIGKVVSRADESSPQGRAFVTGDPIICNDLNKDTSFVLPAFYSEHGIISTVDVVIIKKDGTPYGVLEIDSPRQHDYGKHDIAFLTGFANILAEAVNSSKRNFTLQNAFDRMQEMVVDRDRLLEIKNNLLNEKTRLLADKIRLLDDKTILARELQHRVRNNLQLVHGMLDKQMQDTAGTDSKEGISAIARRVTTLAQVYDHLLGAGMTRTIDFGAYLSSLCAKLEVLDHDQRSRKITQTCHCEQVFLDLDTVTALGLVVSELIANSHGHAFSGESTGTIDVTLSINPPRSEATLIFADSGAGFIETDNNNNNNNNNKRHGLGLIRRLVEQVGGSTTLRPGPGAEWTIKFPVPPIQREVSTTVLA